MYDVIARPLQFYYELWPSYAGAITLLTLTVMLVLLLVLALMVSTKVSVCGHPAALVEVAV